MSAPARRVADRAQPWLPLLMQLLPTVGIGYFVVIPRSCIAGVNELTLGFAAANVGFVLSYVAGIRLASRGARRDA